MPATGMRTSSSAMTGSLSGRHPRTAHAAARDRGPGCGHGGGAHGSRSRRSRRVPELWGRRCSDQLFAWRLAPVARRRAAPGRGRAAPGRHRCARAGPGLRWPWSRWPWSRWPWSRWPWSRWPWSRLAPCRRGSRSRPAAGCTGPLVDCAAVSRLAVRMRQSRLCGSLVVPAPVRSRLRAATPGRRTSLARGACAARCRAGSRVTGAGAAGACCRDGVDELGLAQLGRS